jgi:transposase
MSSLVCGLDVHKDSIYATVMNYGGEIVDKRKLTNGDQGFKVADFGLYVAAFNLMARSLA